MKEYQKPEFEVITLIAQEKVTTDDFVDASMGVELAPPDLWG